jgi:hypothetical protein
MLPALYIEYIQDVEFSPNALAITCNLADTDVVSTKLFYLLPAAPSIATTSATNQGTLISELEAAGIIPDVLDTFNPSAKLNLVFATDKGTLQVRW